MESNITSLRFEIERLLEDYNKNASAKDSVGLQKSINNIKALVPNANFLDLMFYGERARTREEIVEEAIRREDIFSEEGRLGLLKYVRQLMRDAINDDLTSPVCRANAEMQLKDIEKKLNELN